MTPGLSLKEHLKEREEIAKSSLNSTWKYFIAKKNINLSAKFKIFRAVTQSIFCYATQVWGFSSFDEVDKIQRYFIKKTFQIA